MVRYQSEYVKDREVDATQWSTCHDGNSVIMARTITFTHPIKTSMGLGPSEARTTRTQRLTRCTDQGILLENVTGVDGIPGADSFRVNDRWVIEPAENEKDSLRLSSSFEIEFTKRSLFRSIIEKNIKKETGDWWKGYARMLQEALADAAEEREVANVLDKDRTEAFSSPNFSAQLEALTRSTNRLLTIIVFLLAAIVIMLGVNLAMAHQELALMRNILETESRQCTIPPEVVGMQSE